MGAIGNPSLETPAKEVQEKLMNVLNLLASNVIFWQKLILQTLHLLIQDEPVINI